MTVTPTGVLLLAYGSPERSDDVEPYFRHIRGGRAPSTDAVDHLRHRYALIGGRSPLRAITDDTAAGLQRVLDGRAPGAYRTYVAMKHWHPFISDVVPSIAADGIRRIIAVVLAPHYSRMSVGGYRHSVDQAIATLADPVDVSFVDSWHLEPSFLALMADRIRDALATFPRDDPGTIHVIFTAHSLPVRIRTWNDPYEAQLLASCRAVGEQAGVDAWEFAWQSAGSTGEPWLGPDLLDVLETMHRNGIRRVLVVPIGFVAEHLEVLYDIDHEAAGAAAALGMTLRRTHMPNATPELIAVLDAVVASRTDARTPV